MADGFPTTITKLTSSPYVVQPKARVQAVLLHATPEGCTRYCAQLTLGMELRIVRAAWGNARRLLMPPLHGLIH